MTTDDKQSLGHWINGEHCASAGGATFTVFNPSDDSPFAVVAEGSAVEMDVAVQSAHDAFQTYRHTSVNDRERWLAAAAALLEERKAEFVDLLIDEAGSTISKAQFETGKAVSFIRAAIGMVRQASINRQIGNRMQPSVRIRCPNTSHIRGVCSGLDRAAPPVSRPGRLT